VKKRGQALVYWGPEAIRPEGRGELEAGRLREPAGPLLPSSCVVPLPPTRPPARAVLWDGFGVTVFERGERAGR
jgi:hypothetical protein